MRLKLLNIAVIAAALLFLLPHFAVLADGGSDVLEPSSDRVVFISDAPRNDKNEYIGQLKGDGSGSNADNPLIPKVYVSDSGNSVPEYMNTALYQATELLKDTGGTVVISGRVYLGEGESFGQGSESRTVETARFGNNVIKFTSVYDGVDYRKENGASLVIASPANVSVNGDSVWENVSISTSGDDRVISFNGYKTEMGNGVECSPFYAEHSNMPQSYVSLAAGAYCGKSDGRSHSLFVSSGTYNKVVGGTWSSESTAGEKTNVKLTLAGKTVIKGAVIGGSANGGEFFGNVDVIVDGGTFECDVYGVGKGGMMNSDGYVNFKINGGNFKSLWSISDAEIGTRNSLPLHSSVDFSDWMGDYTQLAYASRTLMAIKTVKLPTGLTLEKLTEIYEDAKEADTSFVPETAEPDVTENYTVASAPTTDGAETAAKNNPSAEKYGINKTYIVLGTAFVVLMLVVCAVIIFMKNQKDK